MSGVLPGVVPGRRRDRPDGRMAGALLVASILVIGALQSSSDLLHLFRSGEINLVGYEGPAVFKLAKDAIVVLGLLVPSLIGILAHRARVLTADSILALLGVGLLAAISLIENGALVAAAGLRWFLPIALLFLLPARPPAVDPVTASRMLSVALGTNLALQFLQLFTMPPVYGQIWLGLSARTPGLFLVPNTAAFFACVAGAAALSFEHSRALKAAALLAATASCLLTQSGTGLVVIGAMWLPVLGGARRPAVTLIGIGALAVLFFSLGAVTGREDYLRLSGGERIRILVDIVLPMSYRIDGFGVFTNTAALLLDRAATAPDGTVIAIDSFIASFIGNLGAFALPIAILVVRFAARCRFLDLNRLAPLLTVYGLFSFTTIVTEAFPMNVLLPILVWASARESAKRQLRFESVGK